MPAATKGGRTRLAAAPAPIMPAISESRVGFRTSDKTCESHKSPPDDVLIAGAPVARFGLGYTPTHTHAHTIAISGTCASAHNKAVIFAAKPARSRCGAHRGVVVLGLEHPHEPMHATHLLFRAP